MSDINANIALNLNNTKDFPLEEQHDEFEEEYDEENGYLIFKASR